MNSFDHEKFDVYQAAIDFVVVADSIVEDLPRGRARLAAAHRRGFAPYARGWSLSPSGPPKNVPALRRRQAICQAREGAILSNGETFGHGVCSDCGCLLATEGGG